MKTKDKLRNKELQLSAWDLVALERLVRKAIDDGYGGWHLESMETLEMKLQDAAPYKNKKQTPQQPALTRI